MLLATACACGDDGDLGSSGPPVRDIGAGGIHNVVASLYRRRWEEGTILER